MNRLICRVARHRWAPTLHLHGRVLHVQCARCGHRTVAPLATVRSSR